MSSPTFLPGPSSRTVRNSAGEVLSIPVGWELLPPGDPALTRRVKAEGPHWAVQEKRGRKIFSRGVWAPGETIERLRGELVVERADPKYARRLEQDGKRREKVQAEYVEDFTQSVRDFLAFDVRYAVLAGRLAEAVSKHATPVGSGTVARTRRIPIEQRAEAAVIAWMRHQTTAYDSMHIPRVRGKRREIRRQLAQRSHQLLERYRRGQTPPPDCPLQRALDESVDQ